MNYQIEKTGIVKINNYGDIAIDDLNILEKIGENFFKDGKQGEYDEKLFAGTIKISIEELTTELQEKGV